MAMQYGIMMRGQFPKEDNVAHHFQQMLEQARLAEKLGFHSITKGSHYSTHPLQDLQQVPFLSRIAAYSLVTYIMTKSISGAVWGVKIANNG